MSVDRTVAKDSAKAAVTPGRIYALVKILSEKIDAADLRARKSDRRSVVSCVEAEDDKDWIVGDKATPATAMAGRQTQAHNVRGFVRKWRARRDFELLTPRFVVWCSIQLSYGRAFHFGQGRTRPNGAAV